MVRATLLWTYLVRTARWTSSAARSMATSSVEGSGASTVTESGREWRRLLCHLTKDLVGCPAPIESECGALAEDDGVDGLIEAFETGCEAVGERCHQ